jgi:hypothetical protein
LPFGAGSFLDVGVAQAQGRVSSVEALPQALREAVLRALAPDPGDRHATPAAFAEALQTAAEPP